MRYRALLNVLAGVAAIGCVPSAFAAQPAPTTLGAPGETPAISVASPAKPSKTCLNHLSAFKTKIDKDGFWLGGSGDGYGFPIGGWGYGYGYTIGIDQPHGGVGYQDARPGYEIRVLLSSANILARRGSEKPCEDVLANINGIYDRYAAKARADNPERYNVPGWRQRQIAAAVPIAGQAISVRSDELIGTELLNQDNQELGSVDDLVMSPTTGKIAYLIITRGGLFGIDQKYVPVPWADIKATPNVNLLILDSTKNAMDEAPEVSRNQFFTPAQYEVTSQAVDLYWKTHLAEKISH